MTTQNDILLDRDTFRNGVFERDNHKCVICGAPTIDAHHIMERRLFKDGGYYLDNGSSLCEIHHLEAESTKLSCEEIRKACNIGRVVLPEHLYSEAEYDKWGNEILKSGQRLPGELFNDPSVQKILKVGGFLGDSHPSRSWVKNLWAQKAYNIPKDWRVCGENMYAKHAIHYSNANGNALDTYFYMFSIWDERNMCLSWDETAEWAGLLDITLVPVLYDGIWDIEVIENLNKEMENNPGTIEGYVVRLAREYHYSEFRNVCGKYVRKDHVANNHGHWSTQKITKNELKV